jgi:hypothetical protein
MPLHYMAMHHVGILSKLFPMLKGRNYKSLEPLELVLEKIVCVCVCVCVCIDCRYIGRTDRNSTGRVLQIIMCSGSDEVSYDSLCFKKLWNYLTPVLNILSKILIHFNYRYSGRRVASL